MSDIENRTDEVFNKWESLPTDEAKRKALAEALVDLEKTTCASGILDALEKAAEHQRQIARIQMRD